MECLAHARLTAAGPRLDKDPVSGLRRVGGTTNADFGSFGVICTIWRTRCEMGRPIPAMPGCCCKMAPMTMSATGAHRDEMAELRR